LNKVMEEPYPGTQQTLSREHAISVKTAVLPLAGLRMDRYLNASARRV
jgi:hypothetical protein